MNWLWIEEGEDPLYYSPAVCAGRRKPAIKVPPAMLYSALIMLTCLQVEGFLSYLTAKIVKISGFLVILQAAVWNHSRLRAPT